MGGIPLAEPLIVPASKIVRRRYKGGVNLLMGSEKGGRGDKYNFNENVKS